MNKKYLKDNKELMKEYLYSKNENINLNKITIGSNIKIWWKCSKGHEWQDSVCHRTSGRNCPYCSSQRVLKGYNDLATISPNLVKEWNYKKNEPVTPYDVFPNSNKKQWWKCEKGHEWQDTPNHRVNRKNGCPYCSNHRLLKGYNDLATTHPDLAKQWNYEKNGDLKPSDVFHGSSKKVWWICEKGDEWKSTISSRSFGVGCPYCKKELQTSYPEQAIFFYIKKIFPDTINRYVENNKEIDIFIPSINYGIEYDGERFHTSKSLNKEIIKDEYYKSKGINLIRIKEKKNSKLTLEDNIIYYSPSTNNIQLNDVINLLIDFIFNNLKRKKPSIDVSIDRDNNYILELLLSTKKENSIATDKILLKQWNYEKNGKLNPEYIFKTSGKKVWWKCEKGHEWQAVVNSRNQGKGCPYCSNFLILKGYNDLETLKPDLAKQWNYEKNGDLKPSSISVGSSKKVWWKCEKGHEWQAVVSSRSKGAGCIYCAGQKAIKGVNDLETMNPEISKQWNYAKNGELKPSDVMPKSGKKVWWKCSEGHEWQSKIVDITTRKFECPICKKNI